MDRGWDLVRANAGAQRLFGGLFAPAPMPEEANVLRLVLEPGPVREAVANWDDVAPALLERARREAVGGVLDLATAELVRTLQCAPRHRGRLLPARSGRAAGPGGGHPFPSRGRGAAVLLDGLDHRHAGGRHRPGVAGGGVLPGRRRHPSGLAPDPHSVRGVTVDGGVRAAAVLLRPRDARNSWGVGGRCSGRRRSTVRPRGRVGIGLWGRMLSRCSMVSSCWGSRRQISPACADAWSGKMVVWPAVMPSRMPAATSSVRT